MQGVTYSVFAWRYGVFTGAVFYNPERIGRGIFFDDSKAREGYYEISYNIPTTKAEIMDFTRLAGEMERRLGRVEMYCVEEERAFSIRELEQGIENFAMFNQKSLNKSGFAL